MALRRHSIGPLAAASAALVALFAASAAPSFAASDPSCNVTHVERVVAIGDVHGAYDRLVEILRAAGLVDERLRWTGGTAHLVQAGDVVDRGPDSRKTLDLLRTLEGDASRAGGAVHVLLGNHEVMRMLGDLRYTQPGEYQAFVTGGSEDTRTAYLDQLPPGERDRARGETPLGLVEMHRAFGRQGVYGKWLRTLNTTIRIDGTLFVHGGISPAVATLSCSAINERVRRELTEDEEETRRDPQHSLAAAEDGPLWYRGLATEPDGFEPQVVDILAKQGVTTIVVGHTVTPDARVRARFGGAVVTIDTGMQSAYVSAGRASALEIAHGVFTAIYADRRDVLPRAAETKAAAPAAR